MQPIGQIILTVMDNGGINMKINGLNPPLVVFALEKAKATILSPGPSVAPASPEEINRINGKPQ